MSPRLLRRGVTIAAVAAAALPGTAAARTPVFMSGGVPVLHDFDGVVNHVSVEPWHHGSDGVLFTDSGSTLLRAGAGCTLWDEDIDHPRGDKVFCPGQFFDRITVNLGAGNDSAVTTMEFSPVRLRGGPGDDALWVGRGEAVVLGGPGDDVMSGAEGDQVLAGEGGTDVADYSGQSSDPVDISLDGVADDGIRDFEHDNVMPSTEHVLGSFGGGVLIGSSAQNRLTGGAGPDVIIGGSHRDALLGMGGEDLLYSQDGETDLTVDCGAGRDMAVADPADPAGGSAGCESVRQAG